MGDEEDYERVIEAADRAFAIWRMTPAPKRGEIVREIANALREHKDDLGTLVTLEMGKLLIEGKGEVQEMIDMADLAVGMSRQLHGLTMHSERPGHRMYEQYHPLGKVGIITAFNFPVAVWSWNALVAAVCGDVSMWKPAKKTPLCAIATQHIVNKVLAIHGVQGIMTLIVAPGQSIGEAMLADRRLPLISATGSCRIGRRIGEVVNQRLGRSLLELGGNNAIIVSDDCNMELALRAVLFGAVGTAGQRCTSTRRVIIQEGIYDEFVQKLKGYYGKIRIGNPLADGVLMGPLIDQDAVNTMQTALVQVTAQGGKIISGGKALEGCYAEPTLVEATAEMPIVQEETFAPILYLMPYSTLEEAIEIQNGVDQGLSSAIFTNNVQESETFLSHAGSDCGLANVNIGTSGAEIGGAFGGEKDTGGGREAGSDAWKTYMRRQTNTINFSSDLPLAQGITFDV
jgi:aldehyde dehydrogenase (NAD+)